MPNNGIDLFQKPIRVTVLRENHAVHLSLVPKQWSGQGFLG